jgi:transposase-like protein
MSQPSSYRGYRFPADIISHAVWLYFRFGLSFRDVEDLLAERGITVTYEAIRQWCPTFGLAFRPIGRASFLITERHGPEDRLSNAVC